MATAFVVNPEKQNFFSTVMKEILSEFGLQGVSHRSATAVHTCVSVQLCVCVHCSLSLCVFVVSLSCHAQLESHLSVLTLWFHSVCNR